MSNKFNKLTQIFRHKNNNNKIQMIGYNKSSVSTIIKIKLNKKNSNLKSIIKTMIKWIYNKKLKTKFK
jgi:hypothetical protein